MLAATTALVLACLPFQGRELDNFRPVPGAATAPLGSLGHVERRGRGDVTLLLLPGAGFGWRTWAGFMERNAERWAMVAVTPAGYDGTLPPPLPEAPFAEQVWTDAFLDGVRALVEREPERSAVPLPGDAVRDLLPSVCSVPNRTNPITPASRIAELTPWGWAAARAAEASQPAS